jgi:hypothetical protein
MSVVSLRSCCVGLVLALAPALAGAQNPAATPRASLMVGLGNDFGWFGALGSAYLTHRIALFAGLGFTPELDPGDPSGLTVAAGVRGFTRGLRHQGFLEVGVTQVCVETSLTPLAGIRGRRLYGPSIQAGYQYLSRGGFTALVSGGGGYSLGEPVTGSRFQPVVGLGLGYTFRKRGQPR